ncbi:hypothetical protein GX408_06970 [bacterium]|nr:hypothetical protein [bacterium]
MTPRLSLLELADQSLWISDDRISAQIANACNAVSQIDFHGVQPVSRNAKLLQHSEGVLSFSLQPLSGSEAIIVPFALQQLEVSPAGVRSSLTLADWRADLELVVLGSCLWVRCLSRSANEKRTPPPFRFTVTWNRLSQSTAVHGRRTWAEPELIGADRLRLYARDQIKLTEWLQRTGDYQGDFLIPEEWRRIIYRRHCVSGTARWEDVRDEYKQTAFKLYDAGTWIDLGGDGFSVSACAADRYVFASAPFTQQPGGWTSSNFCVCFYSSAPLAGQARKEELSPFDQQQRRYAQLQTESPSLVWPGHDAVSRFFSNVPQMVESARVQDYGMTRACPGTYYWIWAWDNMVTALAQRHWGDIAHLRRVVEFLRVHRDQDGVLPGRWTRSLQPMDSRGFGGFDFLFSELVLMLYAETCDDQILRTNYATVRRSFNALAAAAHENGLVPGFGMYPDLPQKMGRRETSFVAIDNAAWYALCRNMEKMAQMLQDEATARCAYAMAEKVESHFLPMFWDEENGFIHDSVVPASGERVDSYPLFSLLFLESAFGRYLLKEKIEACSRFIADHLLTETGLSLTPVWDRHHQSEPAMSSWYPYWDYPAITVWTLARNGDAVRRWQSLLEQTYQALGYCPEFLALHTAPEERWIRHGAAWNLNCAAGWYNALLTGLFGLRFDLGGITCTAAPSFAGEPPLLTRLSYRFGRWTVRRCGVGNEIKFIRVDGVTIPASWKIPDSFYTSADHQLDIEYGDEPAAGPVLLDLAGASLIQVMGDESGFIWTVHGLGAVDVLFYSPQRPELWLDQTRLPLHWDPDRRTAHARLFLAGRHDLRL